MKVSEGRKSPPTLIPSLSVRDAMPAKELQKKTSLAFDDRTLRTFRKQAGRLNLSVSAFLRLVAAKLESGEIRV